MGELAEKKDVQHCLWTSLGVLVMMTFVGSEVLDMTAYDITILGSWQEIGIKATG